MQWKTHIKVFTVVFILSFIASCVLTGGKKNQTGPLEIPENYGDMKVKQITDSGESLRPFPSDDGKRLLYVSRNKSTHKNLQAYERDLVANKEKRLTYQNGEVFEVQYYNNETRYVYSSSTDEIKENSPFIEKELLAMKGLDANELIQKDDSGLILPRTEIYRATLDSSRIDRITNEPNFDGDISIRGKRHELVFVRWVRDVPQSFVLNTKTKNLSSVGNEKTWTSDPAYSDEGEELAWVEKSDDAGWLLLTGSAYGKNGKVRYQSPHRIRDLVWHPKSNEIFFSEQNASNAEIYALTLETGCKRQITFHSALDFHPYPTADGSKIYFSSDRSGDFQIYEASLTGLPACPETKPTIE